MSTVGKPLMDLKKVSYKDAAKVLTSYVTFSGCENGVLNQLRGNQPQSPCLLAQHLFNQGSPAGW